MTLQELYNDPNRTFVFRLVGVASNRPNSEAPNILEAPFSDKRKYNWYVVSHRIPGKYEVNLLYWDMDFSRNKLN